MKRAAACVVEGLDVVGLEVGQRHAGERPACLFWKEWQVARTPEWKLVQAGEGDVRAGARQVRFSA